MRKLTRGFAALVLGLALAASAVAQQPLTPPAPGSAPTQPAPIIPPPAPPVGVLPTPTAAKAEVRPTGNAAMVNNQPITEVAVYRALRQFPDQHKEMARKEFSRT